MEKKWILCFDCGDTLVDEGTQEFDENGDVTRADPIPGSVEAVRYFHDQGWRLALVADGTVKSFENILGGLGIWDLFETHVISEAVGELKPSEKMFRTARENLGLPDYSRMIMFGNNRLRDIRGANGVGMKNVLLDWSPRYVKTASAPEEEPTYLTRTPAEWIPLVEKLEKESPPGEGRHRIRAGSRRESVGTTLPFFAQAGAVRPASSSYSGNVRQLRPWPVQRSPGEKIPRGFAGPGGRRGIFSFRSLYIPGQGGYTGHGFRFAGPKKESDRKRNE